MKLETLIKDRIRKNGPITVADYMSICLSHPELGYYMRRDPIGALGDFITAPEISQIFGELIGLWLARQWDVLGKPRCALVELGPGRGTLMSDALRATKKIPGFGETVSVHLVETSPVLKQKQWAALANKHTHIHWHESIAELPKDLPWLLVANEFFDALPIRQFIYQDTAWHERMVGYGDGQLTFATASVAKQDSLPGLIDAPPREGVIMEHCQDALDIIADISAHIATVGGAALIIDYGYTQGKGDTLQAVRDHAHHDALQTPGEADLTAHVDFAALKEASEQAGAQVFGATAQGKFLMSIGAGQRVQKLCAQASKEQSAQLISGLKRLASPDQMGELFKAMAVVGKNHPKPEGF